MAKELDLSGVDEILAEEQQAPEQELDLSGVDEILQPTPKSTGEKIGITAKNMSFGKGKALAGAAEYVGEQALESAADLGAGVAQGATFGAADEIGGGLSALIEKGLSYIPGTGAHKLKEANAELGIEDDSLTELYRQYQGESEKAFKEAEERSPILNTVGDLGGSIVSGIMAPQLLAAKLGIGGVKGAQKAKTVYDIYKDQGKLKAGAEFLKRSGKSLAVLAPEIAAEGAFRSEGNLIGGTEQEQTQVTDDMVGALSLGGLLSLGFNGVTEVAAPVAKEVVGNVATKIDNIGNTYPAYRKMKIGYEKARDGLNPLSEAGVTQQRSDHIDGTQELFDKMMKADDAYGKMVSQSLVDAEQKGIRLDMNQAINDTQGNMSLYDLEKMMEDINENSPRGRQVFSRLTGTKDRMVTPTEAHDLLKEVRAYISKFKAIGADKKTMTDNNALKKLMQLDESISKQMKDQIPAYKTATQRFAEFRHFVPETIISGSIPTEITDTYMGSLRNSDKPLFQKLRDLTQRATAEGHSAGDTADAFIMANRGINEHFQRELQRGATPNFDGQSFLDDIKKLSDERQFMEDALTVKSPFKTADNVGGIVANIGRGGLLGGSVLAGKAAKPLTKISRNAYKMPAEKLNELGDKLSAVPGLQSLGQALKDGVANGDQAKKNAALFSILQNPNARLLLDEEEDEGI